MVELAMQLNGTCVEFELGAPLGFFLFIVFKCIHKFSKIPPLNADLPINSCPVYCLNALHVHIISIVIYYFLL